MNTYWDLTKKEKEEYLSKIISESKVGESLSNHVYLGDNVVIKTINPIWDKTKNEVKVLNFLKIKNEINDDYLVFEKRPGSNVKGDMINDIEVISGVIENIKSIQGMKIEGISFGGVKSHFFNKKREINDILIDLKFDTKIYDEMLSNIESEEDIYTSHSDINGNNIMHNNKNIFLIDFEEMCISNKYNDASNFIANWNLSEVEIDYIAEEMFLDKRKLLLFSIIWSILMLLWNKGMFDRFSNDKYKNMTEYFLKRIQYLKEISNNL